MKDRSTLFAKQESAGADSCGLIPAFGGAEIPEGVGFAAATASLFAKQESAGADSCGLIPAFGGADP